MLRSTVSKVAWAGRVTVFLVGLSAILAVVLGGATMAFAANGKPWILGRNNVATAITSLGGRVGVNGPMVRLTNNNAGTDDTALDLKVQSGEAPMTVNSSAKVANLNSDQLDGIDSSGFVQGNGRVLDNAKVIVPNDFGLVVFHAGQSPEIQVLYSCPSSLSNNGTLTVTNIEGNALNVFSDNGGTNPAYVQLAPGAQYSQPAAASGEHITLQVQGAGIATIEVFSVHRQNDCHVQAQGLFTYP